MMQCLQRGGAWRGCGRSSLVAGLTGLAVTASLLAWPTGAAAQDPVVAARFSITIDGREFASFSEAELSSEIVADGSGSSKKLRTQATATFKRAQGSSLEMWAWHEAVLQQRTPPRQNLTVTAYNPQGQAVARYHLTEAWPSKCVVSGLKLSASEVLMESVTVVAERLQRLE